jgi:hypothetical protein
MPLPGVLQGAESVRARGSAIDVSGEFLARSGFIHGVSESQYRAELRAAADS